MTPLPTAISKLSIYWDRELSRGTGRCGTTPIETSHSDHDYMKRSFFVIAITCLAAALPVRSFAQDRVTGDANKQTSEQWQSRVNAGRERLKQRREELRREREERLAPKGEELRLDRDERIEPKQFGPKKEELKLDRENRIEPKREELRRERDRQKEILRERKGFIPPPPTQDEIAEAASQRVLEDHLLPGDIVSTRSGLFRFRGSPNEERKPGDFERLR
jgi:hypothetical protein